MVDSVKLGQWAKAWIGGTKISGKWTWLDGTPYKWTKGWEKNNPSNDGKYMELDSKGGSHTGPGNGWNDLSGSHRRPTLCKLGNDFCITVLKRLGISVYQQIMYRIFLLFRQLRQSVQPRHSWRNVLKH